MLMLSFYIHLTFGSDDRFDIVRFGQCAHIHIVIHHKKPVFQIRPGKVIFFDLLDTGGIHIDSKKRSHDKANAGLAFTAFTDQHQHLLCFGSRDQAVPHIFLQCQNIFRYQKFRKESQPDTRHVYIRIVIDRQPVAAIFFIPSETAIQIPGAVCHMDPVIVQRDVLRISHELDRFQQVIHFPGHAAFLPFTDIIKDDLL